MNVGLVVIVANGQVILNIIKIMTLNEEIYKTVMKIPYGKVATYGQIATICGNPYYARAVGNALHKNPNPQKIPCYRDRKFRLWRFEGAVGFAYKRGYRSN